MQRWGGMFAVVLSVAVAGVACKKRATVPALPPPLPTPTLGPVTVLEITPPGFGPKDIRVDGPLVETTLRKIIEKTGLFSTVLGQQGAGPTVRIKVEVALEEVAAEGKIAARAGVRLRVDVRPVGGAASHWNEDVQAGSETIVSEPKPDRAQVFRKLVARTVDDLWTAYAARQRLWTASPDVIRAALATDAAELKREAIAAIGDRRLSSEVERLFGLLDDPDESLRDAALGALVTLRDPRTVAVLTRKRSLSDRREMRKILDAVASLGGTEAVAYLDFVAAGHDDDEIRQMAARARHRMSGRGDGGI